MINSTSKQENKHVITINNEREIGEDGNSGQLTSRNLLGLGGMEREGGKFHRTSAVQCPVHCAAI